MSLRRFPEECDWSSQRKFGFLDNPGSSLALPGRSWRWFACCRPLPIGSRRRRLVGWSVFAQGARIEGYHAGFRNSPTIRFPDAGHISRQSQISYPLAEPNKSLRPLKDGQGWKYQEEPAW